MSSTCVGHEEKIGREGLFINGTGNALFWGGLIWVFYMALEPSYRRLWPQLLVSWVRLLDGRIRDPLVGRDLLIGVLWGIAGTTAGALLNMGLATGGLSEIPQQASFGPTSLGVAPVQGIGGLLSTFSIIVAVSLINLGIGLVTLVALRLTLRHTLAAVVALISMIALLVASIAQTPQVVLPFFVTMSAMGFFLLFRFGVLFWVIANMVGLLLLRFTLTHVINSWYFGNTIFVVLLVGGIATYGFYTSLAGRSVFSDEDEEAAVAA